MKMWPRIMLGVWFSIGLLHTFLLADKVMEGKAWSSLVNVGFIALSVFYMILNLERILTDHS